ncbi:hypothetical protein ACIGHN_07315 [Acidovorax sp. NPDC077693]|uniref:hypothetical protein n=1 Tax=unclassified Acidovorax TaxID=2684926 RepID=UPI0037C98082
MEPARGVCSACGRLALEETLKAAQGVCMSCVREATDKTLTELHDALCRKFGDLYLSNPLLLPRNKNTAYRDRALCISLGVAQALDEMSLATVSLVTRYREKPEHFYLSDMDLKESGQMFMRANFRQWLAKTDRWKPESRTTDRFKKSLSEDFKAFQKTLSA